MKWSSVKNIMLGMLIVMNVFLLGSLIWKQVSGAKISPVIIAAADEALKKSGIEGGELISRSYESSAVLEAEFFSPAELSRMFFGEQLAFQTDGQRLIARKDGAELVIDDVSFYYSSALSPADVGEDGLRKALSALGLDMRSGSYSEANNIFCLYRDRLPLFGMYIRASLASDGSLCSVEACWPKTLSEAEQLGNLTLISHLPRFSSVFRDGGEIGRIRFGRALSRDTSSDRYEFVPAWRVTLTDGRSAVFM